MNRRAHLVLALCAIAPICSLGAATLPVACSVPALIAAINTANTNAEPDTVELAAGCTYDLSAIDNTSLGDPEGLPIILTDDAVLIHGHGATIRRSSASGTPEFRVMHVRVANSAGTGGSALFAMDDVSVENGDVRTAQGSGGGIYLDPAQSTPGLVQLSQVRVVGNHAFTGGGISTSAPLDLSGSTVEGNHADAYAGGILVASAPLTVTSSRIADNTQGSASLIAQLGDTAYLISGGGGIGAFLAQNLVVLDSEVSGNEAWGIGGGGIGALATPGVMINTRVHNNLIRQPDNVDPAKGEMGSGGGVAVGSFSGGEALSFTIIRSAIHDNSADTSGGGLGFAGAIQAAVDHTTVARNTAGVRAGGIGDAADQVLLNNVTVAGNTAPRGAGVDIGLYTDFGGTNTTGQAWFINTAIGDNSGGTDCYNEGGSVFDNIGSLLETDAAGAKACDGASGKNFAHRGDPGLSVFTDHGGPDSSYLPQPGSVLIDAGAAGWNSSPTDQRGTCYLRVRGTAIDIGSIETGNGEVIFCASFDPSIVAD